jgi:hypothetical protein
MNIRAELPKFFSLKLKPSTLFRGRRKSIFVIALKKQKIQFSGFSLDASIGRQEQHPKIYVCESNLSHERWLFWPRDYMVRPDIHADIGEHSCTVHTQFFLLQFSLFG